MFQAAALGMALAKAMGAKPPREPQTHDYTKRGWGHDFTIMEVLDKGKTLDMWGWGRGIVEGDYLILPAMGATTRYRVGTIRYMSDPTDQWFAQAHFAPRS